MNGSRRAGSVAAACPARPSPRPGLGRDRRGAVAEALVGLCARFVAHFAAKLG